MEIANIVIEAIRKAYDELSVQYTEQLKRLEEDRKELEKRLDAANAGNVNCSGCGMVAINAVRKFISIMLSMSNIKILRDKNSRVEEVFYTISRSNLNKLECKFTDDYQNDKEYMYEQRTAD